MSSIPRISVIIQTYNEETNIKECVESSRQLTDDIILIDTESTDKTVEIAKNMGLQTYTFPFSKIVEPAREFGIQKGAGNWIFILDADERFTPELVDEIKKSVISQEHTHYKVPRKEIFGKKTWLEYGGWWPNHIIRLIHKPSFKSWPKAIHSTPIIEGSCGYLKHALLHYSKNDYEVIVNKTIVFEDEESELLFKADRPVSTPTFFRKFLGETYRRLIKKKGYKDGTIGIIESIYQGFSKTITYLYLYEKKHKSN